MQLNATHTPQLKGIHVLAATSCITILFLAYIDEGYYSFAWMADIGNWVAVALFIGTLFLLQFGAYKLAMRLFRLRDNVITAVFVSLISILALIPALFVIVKGIVRFMMG